MKNKIFKILLISFSLLVINSISIFANGLNNTNSTSSFIQPTNETEYEISSMEIKKDIKILNDKIATMRAYISTTKTDFYNIEKEYVSTKKLSILYENYKKAKELIHSIPEKKSRKNIINDDDSINNYIENKQYDKALDKLKKIKELKQIQYDKYKNTYDICVRINELIK